MSAALHQSFDTRPGTIVALFLLATAAPLRAQPGAAVEVPAEPVAISYVQRHFDGVKIDTVVFTAKSVQFVTDTLGAWTPHGEGTTARGLVLRHRKFPMVFVTLSPFAGPAPSRDADEWRNYRWEVSAHLGADTTIQDLGESGVPGGTPSFASWNTREALFTTPAAGTTIARTERHIVAADGTRGVVLILAGPANEVAAAERDFRFLLARLERHEPVRTAAND